MKQTTLLILRAFFAQEDGKELWLWMPLLFPSGYLLGRWHNLRLRRDRF